MRVLPEANITALALQPGYAFPYVNWGDPDSGRTSANRQVDNFIGRLWDQFLAVGQQMTTQYKRLYHEHYRRVGQRYYKRDVIRTGGFLFWLFYPVRHIRGANGYWGRYWDLVQGGKTQQQALDSIKAFIRNELGRALNKLLSFRRDLLSLIKAAGLCVFKPTPPTTTTGGGGNGGGTTPIVPPIPPTTPGGGGGGTGGGGGGGGGPGPTPPPTTTGGESWLDKILNFFRMLWEKLLSLFQGAGGG